MTTLAAPSNPLVTSQSTHGFNGRDHWSYDLTHPEGAEGELWEIVGELLHADIYELQKLTRKGDVWVDAGSHVGLFSIAAMMAGADVSVMYDMDPTAAWCASANVRSFLMQQIVREYRPRIRTVAVQKEIKNPDELVGAGMQTKEVWDAGWDRVCLKLDIQGAEQLVLALDGPRKLAEAFDVLVFEWHFPEDLPWVSEALERGGWNITAVKQHEDVLLNTTTYIVWAVVDTGSSMV